MRANVKMVIGDREEQAGEHLGHARWEAIRSFCFYLVVALISTNYISKINKLQNYIMSPLHQGSGNTSIYCFMSEEQQRDSHFTGNILRRVQMKRSPTLPKDQRRRFLHRARGSGWDRYTVTTTTTAKSERTLCGQFFSRKWQVGLVRSSALLSLHTRRGVCVVCVRLLPIISISSKLQKHISQDSFFNSTGSNF